MTYDLEDREKSEVEMRVWESLSQEAWQRVEWGKGREEKL